MVWRVSTDVSSQIPCRTKPISCAAKRGETIKSPLTYSPGLKRGSCLCCFLFAEGRAEGEAEKKRRKRIRNKKWNGSSKCLTIAAAVCVLSSRKTKKRISSSSATIGRFRHASYLSPELFVWSTTSKVASIRPLRHKHLKHAQMATSLPSSYRPRAGEVCCDIQSSRERPRGNLFSI